MLLTTTQIIRSALQADPSLNSRDRAQVLALLRDKPKISKADSSAATPRLIRRKEGASRLGMSLRTFDKLCKQGVLKKHVLPGRTRAAGILESDLNTLLAETGKQMEAA